MCHATQKWADQYVDINAHGNNQRTETKVPAKLPANRIEKLA
jgi:hypothetical protein